jgi:hypothetical protein
MNERIKQLEKQATIIEYGVDNGFDRVTFDKEKFAELIVKECADWIDRQDESRCPYGVDLIEHFGVKE